MNRTILFFRTAHERLVRTTTNLQGLFLVAVRVYWGWQLAQNGWAKLHNLPNVIRFFASLGLPAPLTTAVLVSAFELAAGVLLAVGLLSRVAALGVAIDMVAAYMTADREALLSIFSNPGMFYGADPYTFLFAALVILVFGPGRIAIDALFAYVSPRVATVSPRTIFVG